MNKTQIINLLSQHTGLSQYICLIVLDTFFDTILHPLSKGETVTIRGFGKFYTYYQNPKICTIPTSKIPFLAPAKYLIKFKISPAFLQKFKKNL